MQGKNILLNWSGVEITMGINSSHVLLVKLGAMYYNVNPSMHK